MATFNAALFNSALFGGGGALPPGLTPRQVGQGLLYPALRKAQVTLGPGRTPSPAQFQDAIDELNRLTGSLGCDRLFIYSITRQEFALDPVKGSYTIGFSHDPFITVDFPVERPQMIESANVLWGDGSSSPLALAGSVNRGYAAGFYNDRAYPVSTLYFDPVPPSGSTLELLTWTQVPYFQNVTDVVLLPMQYEDALVLNLAVRLAPHFQKDVPPDVRRDAQLSLMRLQSINAPQPIADLNWGPGTWGYYGGDSGALIISGGGSSGAAAIGPAGPPGPQGATGPQGAPGVSSSVFPYRADANSQAANDPGAGMIRWNTANQTLATSLFVDVLTSDDFDVLNLFRAMNPPARFVIQDEDTSQNHQVWQMTAPVVERPDWFEVPVALVSSGGAGTFSHNTRIAVLIMAEGTTGVSTLGLTIDGGGATVTTGVKGYISVPFACTITGWDVVADQAGSVSIEVAKKAGSVPNTTSDKISASTPIALAAAQIAQNGSIAGWTTAVAAGDVIGFNVVSAATVTRVTATLRMTKT